MTGEKLKREASILSSCSLWGATSGAYVCFAPCTSSYKGGVDIYWLWCRVAAGSMFQRMSPLEVADIGGAEDLGSAEDRAVAGALLAADDKSIGIRLLTIPGSNDEV